MSSPAPPHPPNYSSSSHTKSIPVPPAPASTPTSNNGPESMMLQLNIQSLSLDCSIPLGSNLGLQVAVPPAPGSQPTQNNTSPPQQPASSTSQPPSGGSQPQSNTTFGPESILLGLATGFIQRLEKVERDLEDERRVNVECRATIERLKTRLNRLETSLRPADQDIGSQSSSFSTSQIPQNREYQLNPPSQIPIPTALPTRTTPQSYTVKQEIEPEEVDHDSWDQRQPQHGREEVFDDVLDDPTGLGLDDDQAVLYGFKPRQSD